MKKPALFERVRFREGNLFQGFSASQIEARPANAPICAGVGEMVRLATASRITRVSSSLSVVMLKRWAKRAGSPVRGGSELSSVRLSLARQVGTGRRVLIWLFMVSSQCTPNRTKQALFHLPNARLNSPRKARLRACSVRIWAFISLICAIVSTLSFSLPGLVANTHW